MTPSTPQMRPHRAVLVLPATCRKTNIGKAAIRRCARHSSTTSRGDCVSVLDSFSNFAHIYPHSFFLLRRGEYAGPPPSVRRGFAQSVSFFTDLTARNASPLPDSLNCGHVQNGYIKPTIRCTGVVWQCPCGAYNALGRYVCHSCAKQFSIQSLGLPRWSSRCESGHNASTGGVRKSHPAPSPISPCSAPVGSEPSNEDSGAGAWRPNSRVGQSDSKRLHRARAAANGLTNERPTLDPQSVDARRTCKSFAQLHGYQINAGAGNRHFQNSTSSGVKKTHARLRHETTCGRSSWKTPAIGIAQIAHYGDKTSSVVHCLDVDPLCVYCRRSYGCYCGLSESP